MAPWGRKSGFSGLGRPSQALSSPRLCSSRFSVHFWPVLGPRLHEKVCFPAPKSVEPINKMFAPKNENVFLIRCRGYNCGEIAQTGHT